MLARGIRTVLYQGVVNHRDQPQIWLRKNALDTEQGFRTTKLRILAGVGQGPRKGGIRRSRLRLVRLHTAGDRQRAAVSSAGVDSHCTVDVRTTDGTVRRGSDPRCPVLGALLIRQHQQRRLLPVSRTQQPRGRVRLRTRTE